MRNYLNKIRKINPVKILLLLLICFGLLLSISTIHADTIPEKIPANNILDTNHRVNQETINQIIQFNKENDKTKLKLRFRLFIIDNFNQKTLTNIRANTEKLYRKPNDLHQDIYLVIGYNDHKIQTEYVDALSPYIDEVTINQWHQQAIIGLQEDDINKGVTLYLKALNKTFKPHKNIVLKSKSSYDKIFISILIISGSIISLLIGLIIFLLYKWNNRKLRLKRSSYAYRGKDKLYPDMKGFIHNPSWNEKRLRKYIQRLQK